MARQPETVAVVLQELASVGLEATVEPTKKHPKIRFRVDGRRHTYVVPKSTSDGGRAVKNCRCGIRRLLRQLGVGG